MMTNAEAIRILRNAAWFIAPYLESDTSRERVEKAVGMAIKALEPQEAKNSNESSSTHKARDTISRQAAIEWCMEGLNNMPSAEPERKKGKWIPQDFNKHNGMVSTAVYYYPKCSVCGNSANYTNFCPNCGAKMLNGGDQDENR